MIILIVLFGLVIRLVSINQSLWIDEATSALTTKMSLPDFFGKFLPGDFHPPLYYLVLRMWSVVFGTSEIALRSLSILFGLVTIYVIYLIGKELVNKRVGLIASVLLATSGLHIYYSQEARMYSMSTFLVSLAVFSFVKTLTEESRVGNWILFAVALPLIGLTDYLPLLILPVFWVMAFFSRKSFHWWKKYVMSHIVLVVFGVLWMPTFIKQLTSGINVTTTSPSWVNVLGKFSLKEILLIPVKFMIGRVGFDKYTYVFVVGISFVLFGYLLYRALKSLKTTKLIWLWLIVPLSLALVVSIKIPVLNYFRFLFVLPAFYLVVAVGINNLSKSWQRIFIVLVLGLNLVTALVYLFNLRFQREDWKSAVVFVESKRTDKAAVIFTAPSQMEAYRYYLPTANIYGPAAVKKGYPEIWLVRYAQPISDPADTTRAKIEDMGYIKTGEFDFNGVIVWEYKSL